MEFKIVPPGTHFEIILTGELTSHGIQAMLEKLVGHDQWKPGSRFLVDETDLNAARSAVVDIQAIASYCAQKRTELGASRGAILVARDLEFGMNRMWGVFMEDRWEVAVDLFRDRDEAMAWLLE